MTIILLKLDPYKFISRLVLADVSYTLVRSLKKALNYSGDSIGPNSISMTQ